jgi:starvation-inducible DNA-binding protein
LDAFSAVTAFFGQTPMQRVSMIWTGRRSPLPERSAPSASLSVSLPRGPYQPFILRAHLPHSSRTVFQGLWRTWMASTMVKEAQRYPGSSDPAQRRQRRIQTMARKPGTGSVPPALATPSDLGANATRDIAGALNGLLADVFALYLKTKNFHWHMSGPHFRDYHLMLDEQSDQIFAMTDVLAERVRKLGQLTLHSVGEISRNQRISDNDAPYVTPQDMLAELREDNATLAKRMREAHDMVDEHKDVATASLLEVFIDETERRAWFLYESSHAAPGSD